MKLSNDMEQARVVWVRDLAKAGLPYPGEHGLDGFAAGFHEGFMSGVAASVPSEREETIRDDSFNIRPILSEVVRALRKFPTWPTDPLHALAVLGEEFGELTKAMVQLTYEPQKSSREDVYQEALQTAAMAIRLFQSLGRYKYQPGEQHEQ